MQQPGLSSRHSPSRCSGCRQPGGCYCSQMFIPDTANHFHSSTTELTQHVDGFWSFFAPSQPGWFRPLPAEGGYDGKQLPRLWCTRTTSALGWPTRVVIPGSCVSQQDHLERQDMDNLGIWGEPKNILLLDNLAFKMPIILCERNRE